jgi:hypothetical protein
VALNPTDEPKNWHECTGKEDNPYVARHNLLVDSGFSLFPDTHLKAVTLLMDLFLVSGINERIPFYHFLKI